MKLLKIIKISQIPTHDGKQQNKAVDKNIQLNSALSFRLNFHPTNFLPYSDWLTFKFTPTARRL